MFFSQYDRQVEEGERRRVEEEIKSQEADERHQKLVNDFRKLGEDYAALQVASIGDFCILFMKDAYPRLTGFLLFFKTREMESREGRSVLEGRLEVALKEAEQVNPPTFPYLRK